MLPEYNHDLGHDIACHMLKFQPIHRFTALCSGRYWRMHPQYGIPDCHRFTALCSGLYWRMHPQYGIPDCQRNHQLALRYMQIRACTCKIAFLSMTYKEALETTGMLSLKVRSRECIWCSLKTYKTLMINSTEFSPLRTIT